MATKTTKAKRIARPRAQPERKVPALSRYVLRLFVAGATVRSHQAIMRVRDLCENDLKGRVKLEVIDIYQQPALARRNQIVATPTLVLVFPLPLRRFIGSLANITALFVELDGGVQGRLLP